MPKLNQILAVESGIKKKIANEVTQVYHQAQKPQLFEGFNKSYVPKQDGDEVLPTESQRVQATHDGVLQMLANRLTELFDVTATKDFANCGARADVKLDNTVLVSQAPATYLLFLEKQLTDLHTILAALPVLDPAQEWSQDPNSGLHRTSVTQTVRTRKQSKPIVLYQATPEHPAQTQLIQEDVVVGYWNQVKMSGAVPAPRKAALLARLEQLQKAVKFAREEANQSEAPHQEIGSTLFNWLFQ